MVGEVHKDVRAAPVPEIVPVLCTVTALVIAHYGKVLFFCGDYWLQWSAWAIGANFDNSALRRQGEGIHCNGMSRFYYGKPKMLPEEARKFFTNFALIQQGGEYTYPVSD